MRDGYDAAMEPGSYPAPEPDVIADRLLRGVCWLCGGRGYVCSDDDEQVNPLVSAVYEYQSTRNTRTMCWECASIRMTATPPVPPPPATP